MLSYRHSFHAGNFADVLKHIVLIEILQHLCKKPGAFDYIDTHAGAGLFDLTSAHASKLQEYSGGVGKLLSGDWPELSDYLDVVRAHNAPGKLQRYPGSPLIAQQFLRSGDRAWLYELHPADNAALQHLMAHDRRVRVMKDDGFKGLAAQVPPLSRRALILVDPSYEMKTDYEQVVHCLSQACHKFATGIYALWYPVVERSRILQLETDLVATGLRKIQRFELGTDTDSPGRGMSAAGIIVINPPWTLMDKMSSILPRLADVLGNQKSGSYTCDELA